MTETETWYAIASSFYNYAVAAGITGLTQPTTSDSAVTLIRKVSIYTAKIYNLRSS